MTNDIFPLWSLGFLLTYLEAFVGSQEMACGWSLFSRFPRSICGIHQRGIYPHSGLWHLPGREQQTQRKPGRMRKGRLVVFLWGIFFQRRGVGWNGCTVGVNPIQLRDFSTWKLLFHINSQAEKWLVTLFLCGLKLYICREQKRDTRWQEQAQALQPNPQVDERVCAAEQSIQ